MTAPKTLRASVLLEAAHEFADAAGAKIMPFFRKPHAVENKDAGRGFDPVTAADKAAERTIRKAIRQRFPDHGILGEEYADHDSDSRYRWVLDPIDGTRAFISGFPLWGTLIGVLEGDTPVVGLMDQPYTRERFWAAGGKTRMRSVDGKIRTVETRACAKLADAVMVSTAPDLFKTEAEQAAFARVRAVTRMTRYGGDCYAYCMLAAGQIDLVVEAGLKAVDIVALIPIIEQAGGRVTTWDGGSAIHGGQIIAAGDVRTHTAAMKLLAGR